MRQGIDAANFHTTFNKDFSLGAGFGRRTSTYAASSSVVLMPSGHGLGPRNPQTPPS
jgi:hypothetical protein